MRTLRAFLAFWYDFIVGDDWTVAVAVVLALAATVALCRAHVPAWWLPPLAVLVVLGASLLRAARRAQSPPAAQPPEDPG
jgi:hypothetical protein